MSNSYYIVECNNAQWFNLFIVKAKNKQDAISKVWEEYFTNQTIRDGDEPYFKNDLSARRVDDDFKEIGTDVVCLN